MIVSQADKQRVWHEAFMAAITGLSANRELTSGEIGKKAVEIANMALSHYSNAVSGKSSF
jgi:hypothetical protein